MKYKPVKRPKRTVIVNNNGVKYVYLTQEVKYDKKTKRSSPKRIAIGKLNKDNLLIPNKNYLELFQNATLLEPLKRNDTISVGPQFIVSKIIENYDLRVLLESIFKADTNKILDIATYMIVSENNVMQYFEDYGYNHSLFNIKNFTDNTISNLFARLKAKDIDAFIKAWVLMNTHKDVYIAYDSTNMNTVATNIEMAEYGHAKANDKLPQVNISLGYSQDDQLPLFYDVYPGSIIDNSELQKMIDRAEYYGMAKVGFLLDRGYFSKSNIRYLEAKGHSYVIMAKSNALFVQDIIKEYGPQLRFGYSNYIEEVELYGLSVETDLLKTNQQQYVHIYYNGVGAESEKLSINSYWNKMDRDLALKKAKKLKRREDLKQYEKYYRIVFDDYGYFVDYKRKNTELKKMLDSVGYFVIITSEEMSALEALSIYRDRDAIEKVFRMDKSYLGNDVFRVHSDTSLESKMFVSFIALIIRNEIYQRMKPLYAKNRKEFSVPQTIRELERLNMIKLSDEKYHIRYRLTSKQKKILKVFDTNEKEYISYTESLKIPLES